MADVIAVAIPGRGPPKFGGRNTAASSWRSMQPHSADMLSHSAALLTPDNEKLSGVGRGEGHVLAAIAW